MSLKDKINDDKKYKLLMKIEEYFDGSEKSQAILSKLIIENIDEGWIQTTEILKQ